LDKGFNLQRQHFYSKLSSNCGSIMHRIQNHTKVKLSIEEGQLAHIKIRESERILPDKVLTIENSYWA
jgi:hypothetical protein